MNKWLYRAVGALGVASGALLLSNGVAHAQAANDARPDLDPQAMRGLVAEFFTPLGQQGRHREESSIGGLLGNGGPLGGLTGGHGDGGPLGTLAGGLTGSGHGDGGPLGTLTGGLAGSGHGDGGPLGTLTGGGHGDGGPLGALGGLMGGGDNLSGLTDMTRLTDLSRLTDLAGVAKLTDLGGLAKMTDLAGLAKMADLGGLAKTTDLSGLAKMTRLTGLNGVSNLTDLTGEKGLTGITGALTGKGDDGPLATLTGRQSLSGLTDKLADGSLTGLTDKLADGSLSGLTDKLADGSLSGLTDRLTGDLTGKEDGGPLSRLADGLTNPGNVTDSALHGTDLDTDALGETEPGSEVTGKTYDPMPMVQAIIADQLAKYMGVPMEMETVEESSSYSARIEKDLPLLGSLPGLSSLMGGESPLKELLSVGGGLPVVGDVLSGVVQRPTATTPQGDAHGSAGPAGAAPTGTMPSAGMPSRAAVSGDFQGAFSSPASAPSTATSNAAVAAAMPNLLPALATQTAPVPSPAGPQSPAHVGRHRATDRPEVADPELEAAQVPSSLPLLGSLTDVAGAAMDEGVGTLPLNSLMRDMPLVTDVPFVGELDTPLMVLKGFPLAETLAGLVPVESDTAA